MSRSVSAPGGMPAPTTVRTPRGLDVDLEVLAKETCAAYDAEFPDERERYGPAGLLWCRHDNQHLLNWAALSLGFEVDFEQQLAWLARVLEARTFPLARLARDLDLLAETVARHHPDETELQERLLSGGSFLRSRETFLS